MVLSLTLSLSHSSRILHAKHDMLAADTTAINKYGTKRLHTLRLHHYCRTNLKEQYRKIKKITFWWHFIWMSKWILNAVEWASNGMLRSEIASCGINGESEIDFGKILINFSFRLDIDCLRTSLRRVKTKRFSVSTIPLSRKCLKRRPTSFNSFSL